MENTKHDLSSNEVKLDYEALVKTAGYAYACLKEEIRRYLRELDCNELEHNNTSRYLNANWLKETVERFVIAAETYSALVEGKTRESKLIVNV